MRFRPGFSPCAADDGGSFARLATRLKTLVVAKPAQRADGDGSFDRIAEIAARGLGLDIAAISFVEGRQVVVRGSFGIARDSLVSPADVALLACAIAGGDAYVVSDVRRDEPFEAAFTSRGARSYAGVPIFADDGRILGVLGTFDRLPRIFTADQLALLRSCAILVVDADRRIGLPPPPSEAAGSRLTHMERRLALLESVVLSSGVAMAITSPYPNDDPEIIYVNESFSRLFGYAAHEILGREANVLRADDMDPAIKDRVAAARARCEPITVRYPARHKNGTRFWCECTVSPVIGDDGSCEGFVSLLTDITARLAAERFLHDRSAVLESIANNAPIAHIFDAIVASAERSGEGVCASIMLRRADFLYMSVCGAAIREALGDRKPVIAIGDPEDPAAIAAGLGEQRHAPLTPQAIGGTYGRIIKELAFTACISTPILSSDGEVIGVFGQHSMGDRVFTDDDFRVGTELAHLVGIATERRTDRARLEFLAHHDTLTGLPNRLSFERQIMYAIPLAANRERRFALCTLDLNRFKIVNDGFGHAEGDRLLREVAGRLARAIRPGDTIARLGGDGFAILIDDIGERDEAADVARALLAALAPSFQSNDQEVFIRGCIGIATYPDDGEDAATLLGRCENALEMAYQRGVDLAFFHPDDASVGRSGTARIALETSLRHALRRDEFYVLFQPQVDLRRRELRGAEALLRWRDPSRGDVLPDEFIRAAEDTGLIVPIGAWILDQACAFARRWQDAALERFVSVNVSARQFDRSDFVSTVMDALARSGLEPHRLHLELTESLVMRSPEVAAATLRDLKTIGVKLSIDDFGTGYSSFTYLKRFPIDSLKIDRLFVRDIGFGGEGNEDEAIVRAIVGVARALDLDIVAEGVETEAQASFLRAIGVPLAQGFLFAPALEADAVFDWRRIEVA